MTPEEAKAAGWGKTKKGKPKKKMQPTAKDKAAVRTTGRYRIALGGETVYRGDDFEAAKAAAYALGCVLLPQEPLRNLDMNFAHRAHRPDAAYYRRKAGLDAALETDASIEDLA